MIIKVSNAKSLEDVLSKSLYKFLLFVSQRSLQCRAQLLVSIDQFSGGDKDLYVIDIDEDDFSYYLSYLDILFVPTFIFINKEKEVRKHPGLFKRKELKELMRING